MVKSEYVRNSFRAALEYLRADGCSKVLPAVCCLLPAACCANCSSSDSVHVVTSVVPMAVEDLCPRNALETPRSMSPLAVPHHIVSRRMHATFIYWLCMT